MSSGFDAAAGPTVTRTAVAAFLIALTGCAGTHSAAAPAKVVVARAAAPAGDKADPVEVAALQKTLRDLLVANLPDPLVQSNPGWGRQKEGVVGVTYVKDGPHLRSDLVKGMRNDGAWRRVSVRAVNPAQSLVVAISDATYPEPGRATFSARVGVDCDLKFEQQLWRNGTRLYSGETRGRCRGTVLLTCDLASRTETKPGSLLPDLVFRMRVSNAQLSYDDIVIEHTAGVGGGAAKVLGEAVLDAVKRVKPDLERDLLDKANAAILKAADTKEVRVSFDAMLKGGSVIERKK